MKKKVLITTLEVKIGFEKLEELFDVTYAQYSRDEMLEVIDQYDAIVALFNNSHAIDREIMEAAKGKVKIISNYGVGYDKIDTVVAAELGIVVTNTPDVVTEPTAELAMGMMVDVVRNISQADKDLRSKDKEYKWGPMQSIGTTLWGKRLGIIGMGRIGMALARRAKAFGMEIVYHNRHKLSTMDEWQYDATYLSKEELLSTCDVLSLNAPATADTFHIIGKEELKMMKKSAVIVNTSRGTLIDEAALITALKEGEIAAAALDVFEGGDGFISPELLEMNNVVLTPHLGTQTYEGRRGIAEYASQNIILFFNGEEPLSKVN